MWQYFLWISFKTSLWTTKRSQSHYLWLKTYFLTTNRNTYWSCVIFPALFPPDFKCFYIFNQIYVEHLPPLKENRHILFCCTLHTRVFFFFFFKVYGNPAWSKSVLTICSNVICSVCVISHLVILIIFHFSLLLYLLQWSVIFDIIVTKRLQLAEASHDN